MLNSCLSFPKVEWKVVGNSGYWSFIAFCMNSFMKKRSSKPSLTNLTKPLLKCRVTKNPLKCGVIVNCPKFYLYFWYSHSFMQTCPLKNNDHLHPNTNLDHWLPKLTIKKPVKPSKSANKCKYQSYNWMRLKTWSGIFAFLSTPSKNS